MNKNFKRRGNFWRGDDGCLRVEVHEQAKTVSLWLTNSEKNAPLFLDSLKPLYQRYRAQNYLVAVFLSGSEDLYQQTRDLLVYNRRRIAEKEVQAQKRTEQMMAT